MIKYILFSVLFAGVSCTSSPEGAELRKKKASFLPENDYHLIDPNPDSGYGIQKNEFDAILDRIETIYTPIVANFGASLVVERDWNSNTVNAYAQQQGNTWTISFYGGLARRPEVTPEGFALVVCHEMGHHLAGFPQYPDSQWASNEGNSDFFSTAACARKVFDTNENPDDGNSGNDQEQGPCGFLPDYESDIAASGPCKTMGLYGIDKTICERSLAGGLSLGKLLAALNNEPVPSYNTPDRTIVKQTQHSHPKAQCRLDTYKHGTLCLKNWNDGIIPKNYNDFSKNSCATRPACWFAK